MSDRARLGVVLIADRAFDEPSSPLSDQALLPAVLKDDDAQRNGGSHANFPKASCSETRGRGDAEADCVACLLLFKARTRPSQRVLLLICTWGRHECVSTVCEPLDSCPSNQCAVQVWCESPQQKPLRLHQAKQGHGRLRRLWQKQVVVPGGRQGPPTREPAHAQARRLILSECWERLEWAIMMQ